MSCALSHSGVRLCGTPSVRRRQWRIYASESPEEDSSKPLPSSKSSSFSWLRRAPRIRYRRPESRCPDQLLDLTVLNERLKGSSPWEVRRKIEYLKKRQENWDMVYEIIMKREAAVTLHHVEEASQKVEVALSEKSKESKSVVELKRELVELQKEVEAAHEKLHTTQARVTRNLHHIQNLKSQLEISQGQLAGEGTETPSSSLRSVYLGTSLMNDWYPVAFSRNLNEKDKLLPFELFRQVWVLFRDVYGNPACVQDECAHRACPLSIGKVVDGQISCPYHGWEYDRSGSCVKMPSTVFRKDVAINALPVVEKDGFIWVWPGKEEPPQNMEPPTFARLSDDFSVVSETEISGHVDKSLLVSRLLDEEYPPFRSLFKGAFGSDFTRQGTWRKHLLESTFAPPCCVTSIIDLSNSTTAARRKVVSLLNVCLPVSDNEVRILQRMALNFGKWTYQMPLARRRLQEVAKTALREDLIPTRQQD